MKYGRYASGREHEIKIRLSDEEFGKLAEETAQSGLSREEYCRRILAGAAVTQAHPEALTEAVRKLRQAEDMISLASGPRGMQTDPDTAERLLMTVWEAEKQVSGACS